VGLPTEISPGEKGRLRRVRTSLGMTIAQRGKGLLRSVKIACCARNETQFTTDQKAGRVGPSFGVISLLIEMRNTSTKRDTFLSYELKGWAFQLSMPLQLRFELRLLGNGRKSLHNVPFRLRY